MLTAQDHESWRIKQCSTAVCCRQMGAKMVDASSLLIDFANGSVKRGAMPVLGLVNVHGARMYYECQTTWVNQMEDLSYNCSTSSQFTFHRSSANQSPGHEIHEIHAHHFNKPTNPLPLIIAIVYPLYELQIRISTAGMSVHSMQDVKLQNHKWQSF